MDGGNLNPDYSNLGQQLQEQMENEELEELKTELDLNKKRLRETERDNIRMKRSMDKYNTLEAEKKKLERLVIELNREKVEHVEVLLQSMF